MSFYNSGGNGGGFYNSGAGGAGSGYGGDQFQNQNQQQPGGGYNNNTNNNANNYSQWQQQPTATSHHQTTTNPNQQYQQHQSQAMSSNNNVQQQQQQQQTNNAPFWNPSTATAVAGFAAQAAAGNFSNDAALDLAGKLGSRVWESGPASMIPGFDRTMQALRSYYAVDNRYVKRKMQKVLFPFLARNWKRMVSKKKLFFLLSFSHSTSISTKTLYYECMI